MKAAIYLIFWMGLISGCTQHRYLINQPKKYYVSPPIAFMTCIVSFRERTGAWPVSMEDLIKDSEENRKIIYNLPYSKATFRTRKKDVLIVDFSGYQKDPRFTHSKPGEVDPRVVNGRIRFYKSKGRFTWEVYYKSET